MYRLPVCKHVVHLGGGATQLDPSVVQAMTDARLPVVTGFINTYLVGFRFCKQSSGKSESPYQITRSCVAQYVAITCATSLEGLGDELVTCLSLSDHVCIAVQSGSRSTARQQKGLRARKRTRSVGVV